MRTLLSPASLDSITSIGVHSQLQTAAAAAMVHVHVHGSGLLIFEFAWHNFFGAAGNLRAKIKRRIVDGQTIGHLTGKFVDGQAIGHLTGEFVDGQTISQPTGEFVDGQTIVQPIANSSTDHGTMDADRRRRRSYPPLGGAAPDI